MSINLLNNTITENDVQLIKYVLSELAAIMDELCCADGYDSGLAESSENIRVIIRELDKPHPSLSDSYLEIIALSIDNRISSESDPILRSKLATVGSKITDALDSLRKHRK